MPAGTRPIDELAAFVAGREPRRLGATTHADQELRDALTRARRAKDDVELERMRTAVAATAAGFAELQQLIEQETFDPPADFYRDLDGWHVTIGDSDLDR